MCSLFSTTAPFKLEKSGQNQFHNFSSPLYRNSQRLITFESKTALNKRQYATEKIAVATKEEAGSDSKTAAAAAAASEAAVLVAGAVTTPEQLEFEAAMKEPNPKFAVVYVGGHQYKVAAGDTVLVTKLEAPVGARLALKKVLLVGSRAGTLIGMPLVQRAHVLAAVEQQALTEKMYVFKKRRRKNSQRTRGVRHPVTQLRILQVLAPGYDL